MLGSYLRLQHGYIAPLYFKSWSSSSSLPSSSSPWDKSFAKKILKAIHHVSGQIFILLLRSRYETPAFIILYIKWAITNPLGAPDSHVSSQKGLITCPSWESERSETGRACIGDQSEWIAGVSLIVPSHIRRSPFVCIYHHRDISGDV